MYQTSQLVFWGKEELMRDGYSMKLPVQRRHEKLGSNRELQIVLLRVYSWLLLTVFYYLCFGIGRRQEKTNICFFFQHNGLCLQVCRKYKEVEPRLGNAWRQLPAFDKFMHRFWYKTLDERGFSALKKACPRQDCVRGCFQETKTGGSSFRLKADGVL